MMWEHAIAADDRELTEQFDAADWAQTALGPVEGWPHSLRTAVDICLGSRLPMVLWWGPGLVMVHNDAFRAILAPRALAFGAPAATAWPEAWPVIGPMLHQVMAGAGSTWSEDQLLLLDRDGEPEERYLTFSNSPVSLESGVVGGVFGAITDTTERVLAERRLATVEALSTKLAECTTPDDALRTAARVLVENRSDHPLVSVIDCTAGMHAYGEVPSAMRERVHDLAVAVATTGSPDRLAIDAAEDAGVVALHGLPIGPPGQVRAVLLVGQSRRRPWDDALEAYTVLCAARLGTGLRSIELLDLERQRASGLVEIDEAKTAFFTNVSHELRTPLTLIAGPVHEALADPDLPSEQRARLRMIARNTTRLARMVDAMLDFDRMAAGRIAARLVLLDVAHFVRGIAADFAPAIHRSGLRFTIQTDELPRRALLDREMVERIVLNLLTNALKYTPDGTITLRLVSEPHGFAIEVSDSGIGIDAQDHERIFDRFVQLPRRPRVRSSEGAGIGLAMTKQLTELLGGSVELRSQLDRGSTFIVHLPYDGPGGESSDALPITPRPVADFLAETDGWDLPYAAAPAPAPEVHSGGGAVSGRPRVVVAEDSSDMRTFLRDVLADAYDVTVCGDGRSALEEVRRSRPDAVLADVMMPRLDGIQLVREIREDPSLADLPVILVSARAGDRNTATSLDSGADDYLVKPFSVAELRARLASNLERARARVRDTAWRRAVMTSFHDPLIIADSSGRVIELNTAFTDLFRWSMADGPFDAPHPWWPDRASEVSAERDDEIFPDPHPGHPGNPESEGSLRREIRLLTKDGEDVWVTADVRRIEDADRRGGLTMTTLHDVTRERDARHRRAAAVRLSAEFGNAQDLDQVLSAAVAGFAELFDGDSTVRATTGAEDHVFTAAGPVMRDEVDSEIWEAVSSSSQPESRLVEASSTPVGGLLLVPDHPDSGCRIWIGFRRPRRVTSDEWIVGGLLAQAFALAVDRVVAASDFADREIHLERAIESHRLIGQAIGILVERHRVTPAEAFAMLRTASQERNIKLREIAARVIETGSEPDQAG